MGKQVFGTKEWADQSADCVVGCSHDCRYCYARAEAARYHRRHPERWQEEQIRMDRIIKVANMKPCRVMFPAHHDITPDVLPYCLDAIGSLLMADHRLLIVSKPHLDCIQAICEGFAVHKDRIMFRFTIGSADDEVLTFWEPHAPAFTERLESLQMARQWDFATSVSCEPMLDGHIEAVIDAVRPHVTDAIWLGLPNFLMNRVALNQQNDAVKVEARKLIATLDDERIADLYMKYGANPMIKWKESIKKKVGIALSTKAGLDR